MRKRLKVYVNVKGLSLRFMSCKLTGLSLRNVCSSWINGVYVNVVWLDKLVVCSVREGGQGFVMLLIC